MPWRHAASAAMPLRASSLKLVTLQMSAATPCAVSRTAAALIASPSIAPDASSWTRRWPSWPPARNRYMPRSTPSCAAGGSDGWATLSFIAVT